MRFIVNSILLLVALPIFSQEKWEISTWEAFEQSMEKVAEQYKVPRYSVDLVYSSYKGLKSDVAFEKANGYYQKDGSTFQTYIMGITTLQNNKVKVTLDSINQIIAVNHPDQGTDQANTLEQYKQTKELIETLKTVRSGPFLKYQLNYNDKSPVKTVELTIDRNDRLYEIRIYYAKEKEYQTEAGETKKDHAWLKIEYNNYLSKLTRKKLPVSELVSVHNNEYELNKTYEKFQLIDFRLKN